MKLPECPLCGAPFLESDQSFVIVNEERYDVTRHGRVWKEASVQLVMFCGTPGCEGEWVTDIPACHFDWYAQGKRVPRPVIQIVLTEM